MSNLEISLLTGVCENIPDAICVVDSSLTIRFFSKGGERMLGYGADELIGQPLAKIIPPDMVQREIDHCVRELRESGRIPPYETIRLSRDGTRVEIEMTAVALTTEDGEVYFASIMRDIRERKRMEKSLRQSEEEFRAIFNASGDAFFVHDTKTGEILEVNSKFQELYGYTPEDTARLNVRSLSAPDQMPDAPDPLTLIHRAAAGEHQFFQWRALSKTGRIFPVEVSLQNVLLKGENRVLATVRDITEREQTLELLQLTQFSVENASICVFLVGPDARLLYVNAETCRMLGYTREELLGMGVYDLDPDFPLSVWPSHWDRLKKEKRMHFETRHRRKDGTLVPIELSLNYVSFAGREYNVAFGQNISRRRKTEQELRESEERYRSIVETSTEWVWEMDIEGRLTFNNPAIRDILGYDPQELIGKKILDLILEEDRNEAARKIKAAIDEKRGWRSCLVRWKHRDGSIRFLESNSAPVLSEHGELTGFRGTDHDMTEIKSAQASLQAAYAELEAKVQERTRELAQTNEELKMEITERRKAVDLLRISRDLSEALNNLDAVIHSTLDADEIMQRVVEESARAIDADATLIGVFERDVFRVRYVHNMPESFTRRTLSGNELRAIHHAARAGDALAFNDAFNDDRLNTRFTREIGIRSLLVAPLFTRKKITGALAFYGLSRQILFREEHLEFARRLAASVSLALENGRLYHELRTSEGRLNALLNSIPDIAWLKDRTGNFILVNNPFAALTGKPVEELAGRSDFDVWPPDLAEKYHADDEEVIRSRTVKKVEERIAPSNEPARWIETIKTPIYDQKGDVVGTAGIARDITERRRMEEEIRHMAQHDALTGLPNRRLFIDILRIELAQARRHGRRAAVLFLDLDRFKEINDTLGHDFGDQLLQQVAARLRGSIRESDTVARIGGDEFNMVLSDIVRSEGVSEIAQKILNSLRDPIVLGGHHLHVTTSVGISLFPDDSDEVETLLRYADIAMYHAKESGRNTHRFYNPSINDRSVERMRLEARLRQSIERGELSIHYQPQIDILSGRISYAEALVRWNHPERGLLAPAEFLPLADETGFITSIDEWVLKTVCTQARSWKAAGLDSFCVTVNLSARQFQSPDLVSLITGALRDSGMPPSCLDIEVTENTAMSNIERTARQLRELTGMGVHISIDDFGTGYSSLSYLKKLPIERIKIDKSFIQDIARDQDDRAIISAVVSMPEAWGSGPLPREWRQRSNMRS